MRKLVVILAASIAAGLIAVPALAATKTVKVGDIFYVKKGAKNPTVSVTAGSTVTWTWTGSFPHNVTVKTGPVRFHSRTQTKGTFSKKLTKKGTYKIYCSVHGAAAQSMTIKVS